MTEQEKSELLYVIGNKYDIKTVDMLALCSIVGVKYPPQPIEIGKPAPVTLAI